MNKQLKTLERTVVLVSLPLTRTKISTLNYIYQVYGKILAEAQEHMWSNSISSWIKAKKLLYRRFREKYPDIPSHYIHEAIRDASRESRALGSSRRKD